MLSRVTQTSFSDSSFNYFHQARNFAPLIKVCESKNPDTDLIKLLVEANYDKTGLSLALTTICRNSNPNKEIIELFS